MSTINKAGLILAFVLLVTAGIAVLARDKNQAAEDSSDGTIQGTVVAGPQCPVVRFQSEECEDQPIATTVRVRRDNENRTLVKQQRVENGQFEFMLRPGRYILEAGAENPGDFPYCRPVEVLVQPGESDSVIINCDTGIR